MGSRISLFSLLPFLSFSEPCGGYRDRQPSYKGKPKQQQAKLSKLSKKVRGKHGIQQ